MKNVRLNYALVTTILLFLFSFHIQATALDSLANSEIITTIGKPMVALQSQQDPTNLNVSIQEDITPDFWKDSFNLYGIIALGVSFVALLFSVITYFAQLRTEKHTRNAPMSVQEGKLKDLPRHFYRNLVCTFAMIVRFLDKSNVSSGRRLYYPSESNLGKLEMLPDDIILNIDADENTYKALHEYKLLLRNYSTEVQVASNHFSRKNIDDTSLEQDIDNLLFKPLFLVVRSYESRSLLTNETYIQRVSDTVYSILIEHFKKLYDNLSTLQQINSITYLEIISNNGGLSYYDLKERIGIDGGLKRSIKFMYKYLKNHVKHNKKDAEDTDEKIIVKNDFISYILEGKKTDGKLIVNKKDFISYISKHLKTNEKFGKFIDNLINKSYDNEISKLPEINELKYYLEYIAKEEWEFQELLDVILRVDIAIETNRIGMINFD